jgi:transposase
MFVKVSTIKNHKYVQIVSSYRDENNNVRHKILSHLGRLDALPHGSLLNIGKKFLELSGVATKTEVIEKCSEAEILNWGYLVYKNLWSKFKIDNVLGDIQTHNGKAIFDLNLAVFAMVIQHLLAPCSKFKTCAEQQKYLELAPYNLNHLYRALDILAQNKPELEEKLFSFGNKKSQVVDVVFYDVTTFHFESVQQDELRDFGFSKANKFNEVQVMLGMFTDCEGIPLGYELFPGNTYEGKTLEVALAAIEKWCNIRKIIIVADRGINRKTNLKIIKDKGHGYIVATRIKNLSSKIQAKIFNEAGYENLTKEDVPIKYKTFDYTNTFKDENKKKITLAEKMIITYSMKRAAKDTADRRRLLEKAEFYLQNKACIKSSNKRGGKKYLKETNKTDWALNQKAIEKDAKFDGYYAIQTSEIDISPQEILDAHHMLWKIEESFRIMKSTIETRPIFHWTEKRIRGHFAICYLAFWLERALEIKLHKNNIEATPTTIREALNAMRISTIELDGKKLFIKTKNTDLGSKILHVLRITQPNNLSQNTKFMTQ